MFEPDEQSVDRHVVGAGVVPGAQLLALQQHVVQQTRRAEAEQVRLQPLLARGLGDRHEVLDRQARGRRGAGARDRPGRLLSATEASERVGASDVLGGTYTPHCAAIQPAKLVRGLAAAVERLGVRLHERTPVTAIDRRVRDLHAGRCGPPVVVRATEGYTPRLPGLRRAIAPVYSLMVATEPLPASFWAAVGLRARARRSPTTGT